MAKWCKIIATYTPFRKGDFIMALKRINTSMDEILVAKVDSCAAKWGVSRAAALSVICSHYFEQQEAMSAIAKLATLQENLQVIQDKQ